MAERERAYVIVCKELCYGPFACPKEAAEWAATRAVYRLGETQLWVSGEWVLREVVRP